MLVKRSYASCFNDSLKAKAVARYLSRIKSSTYSIDLCIECTIVANILKWTWRWDNALENTFHNTMLNSRWYNRVPMVVLHFAARFMWTLSPYIDISSRIKLVHIHDDSDRVETQNAHTSKYVHISLRAFCNGCKGCLHYGWKLPLDLVRPLPSCETVWKTMKLKIRCRRLSSDCSRQTFNFTLNYARVNAITMKTWEVMNFRYSHHATQNVKRGQYLRLFF